MFNIYALLKRIIRNVRIHGWMTPTGQENFGILYAKDWLKLPPRK